MPKDEREGVSAPVPTWAEQILKKALRDLRYNTVMLPGTHDEKILLLVRRGDKEIGTLTIEHRIIKEPAERHDIPILFKGLERKEAHEERFTPHSLKQMEEFAPVIGGRICKYGVSKFPKWCEDCGDAKRHMAGLFDPPKGPQIEPF
jgi:hypothetical protein